MKRVFTVLLSLVSFVSFAQTTVSLGVGYSQDVYYKLAGGNHTEVSNSNWDLAIATNAFDVSIRANHKKGITVYAINGDSASFAGVDTTGISGWDTYYNSDKAWEEGALNVPAMGGLDYGWGNYNPGSHAVEGNRIFILESSSGYKKVFIKKKNAANVYTFMIANLDDTEAYDVTLNAAAYGTKIFYYYDATSNSLLDREPAKTDWDLLFTRYYGDQGGGLYYPVVGVLQNPEVKVMQLNKVDIATATYIDQPDTLFSSDISTIGFDWKSFNGASYDMVDSLVYFAKTKDNKVFKIIFNAFGGSATGDISFNQEEVTISVGVNDVYSPVSSLMVYPNPAANYTNIITDAVKNETVYIQVIDMTGRIILMQQAQLNSGLSAIQLQTSSLSSGIYLLRLINDNISLTTRLSVVH